MHSREIKKIGKQRIRERLAIPSNYRHASTIAETPAGLVIAYFAGTHERHADVGIRVSRYVNGQWTWPEEVANGVENDTLRYPCKHALSLTEG